MSQAPSRFPIVTAAVLLGSCVACLVLIGVARWHNEILSGDTTLLGTALAKLYATPMSVMVGAAIAGPHWRRPQTGVMALLIVTALIWNLVVIAEFGFLAFGSFGTKDVLEFCGTFNEEWTFLLAGVLAFVAGKSAGGGK